MTCDGACPAWLHYLNGLDILPPVRRESIPAARVDLAYNLGVLV